VAVDQYADIRRVRHAHDGQRRTHGPGQGAMNRLATRPPGPFRALTQRITAHPKAEWLLTRYPVRRWRATRRWPPVLMLGFFIRDVTQRVQHPDWRVKLAFDAFPLAALAAALAVDAYLQRRARRLAGERSRLAYLASGVALLAVAAGTVAVGWHSFATDTWPADVYGLLAGVCAWSAILALGRALARGPRRRLFWVYPPAGNAK
jgi:hypothetical protein